MSLFNINEQKMLDYYDKLMDQVYLQYHHHQSNIPHYHISAAESAMIAGYTAMADHYASMIDDPGDKRVHLHSDPKFSNGLPRK
jgi:hypothetical protein